MNLRPRRCQFANMPRITDTTYACPHIQCWVQHRGVVAEGDVRCTRCGVMLEWGTE